MLKTLKTTFTARLTVFDNVVMKVQFVKKIERKKM